MAAIHRHVLCLSAYEKTRTTRCARVWEWRRGKAGSVFGQAGANGGDKTREEATIVVYGHVLELARVRDGDDGTS